MPHECRELHEIDCRIAVITVPAEKPSDREAVPQVVCRRGSLAFRNGKTKLRNQFVECLTDCARIDGPPAGEREYRVVR